MEATRTTRTTKYRVKSRIAPGFGWCKVKDFDSADRAEAAMDALYAHDRATGGSSDYRVIEVQS